MSLKQLAKTVISSAKYRSLRIPLGTYLVGAGIDLRSARLGRDVTIRNSRIGSDAVIAEKAWIVDSTCGNFVQLAHGAFLSESTLGDFASMHEKSLAGNSSLGVCSYLAHQTQILGTTVGNFVSIGPDCLIGLPEHPVDWLTTSPHFYGEAKRQSPFNHAELSFPEHGKVVIGSDVWLGARVIVRSGVRIGHGAIVAAGAVVVKDVEPYAIVGGVPAKLIRRRISESDAERMLALAWWGWPFEMLCKIGPLLARNDIDGLEELAGKMT